MSGPSEPGRGSRSSLVGTYALGGLLGGLVGAAAAVLVTELIKRILAVISRQDTWVLIVVPLVGLALSVLVLNGYHRGEALQTLIPEPVRRRRRPGRTLSLATSRDVIRADLTADVLATAGEEERFPWRLAPVRAPSSRRWVSVLRWAPSPRPRTSVSPPEHGLGIGVDDGVGSLGPSPWVVVPQAWPR